MQEIDEQETKALEVEVIDERSPFNKDERRQKVWDLYIRGITATAIAKAVNVSLPTVYNDLKAIGEAYKEDILNADPIAMLAENIQWLSEMERVALYEMHSAETKKHKHKVTHPQTGIVEEVSIDIVDPNKANFLKAALECRKMKIKLQIDTGLIPMGDPTKFFSNLKSYDLSERELEEDASERTPEEMQEALKNLLKNSRTM